MSRQEHHKETVIEHKLVVGEVTLSEVQKYQIVTNRNEPEPISITLIHTRTIGDRTIESKMVVVDGKEEKSVSTTLNEEEIEKFDAEWKALWTPKITDQEILGERKLI
jgi:hypothetical protein